MKKFIAILACLVLAASFVTPAFAAKPAVPKNGLVMHYNFNGNVDDSANKNNFAAVEESRYVQGVFGKALYFAGDLSNNLYLSSAAPDWTPLTTTGSFSFSAWVKLDAERPLDSALFCFGSWAQGTDTGTYSFIQNGSGNVGFMTNYSAVKYHYAYSAREELYGEDAVSVDDGEWHNIITTYDVTEKVAKIYIDGKLYDIGDDQGKNCNYTFDDHIFIGGRSGDSPLKGALDEVLIYNRALTADEAVAIYSQILADDAPETADAFAVSAAVLVTAAAACVALKKKH